MKDYDTIYHVTDATGHSLEPVGALETTVKIGHNNYYIRFVVCKKLRRPCIIGVNFLQANRMVLKWTEKGHLQVTTEDDIIHSIDTSTKDIKVSAQYGCDLPPRSLITVWARLPKEKLLTGMVYSFRKSEEFVTKHPNICIVEMLHNIDTSDYTLVPVTLINLGKDCKSIRRGDELGYLNVSLEDWGNDFSEIGKVHEIEQKAFIVSPADVPRHRKTILGDKDLSKEEEEKFNTLCDTYSDIFSKGASDIGKTPLIIMDIDTGDSPPVCQKPYNLPLKHAEWVKQELEMLEKAGIISRSVSPWASPIVVVPKKSEPGEPPKKRLCVDYRVINSLLPTVNKAHSKAKGVLTLVPLPKIDEVYAKLRGASVFSAIDATSGYHHMELSEEAKPKSAFITQLDKFEFNRCPFGLAQAPAYFQRLINKILVGIKFAFGYLDDILVFSPDVETHLIHLQVVFQRLREADLKLRKEKCSFFKRNIQYLGHIISEHGIEPVPEKLESIKNMPAPKTPKEVKQFLGLAGYYRKFVPRFADIARPMTHLTKLNVEFEWTETCQQSFDILKRTLYEEPILKYPDPNKPYILYTDASKYAWACVLTQAEEHTREDGVKKIVHHPITYVSGLFKGAQLNWATLTKEAYAIYMSVRKLTYYLEDAEILLRSDHLPLKKFLQKNTLNSKVNNWAVEISPYRITFEYIKGIKNTLADTMSRLITIMPEIQNEPEIGTEYGEPVFHELEPLDAQINSNPSINVLEGVQLMAIPEDEQMEIKTLIEEAIERGELPKLERDEEIEPIMIKNDTFTLPIGKDLLKQMQDRDESLKKIKEQLEQNKIIDRRPYFLEGEILKRKIDDGKLQYDVTVLPKELHSLALQMAHEGMGHNGTPRTYAIIKRLYYWKGLKPAVKQHVKMCRQCQLHNKNTVRYKRLHFDTEPAPMKFISMDLIGEFHPPTSKGNRYALTVIDMHTGYVFCIPIPNKEAATIVKAYLKHVYCLFGGSEKILSDNGTEFKNTYFAEIAQRLGVKYKVYSPPYHPASNGKIESFHYWLKACIAKQISPQVEWDDVIAYACASYNFSPNEFSKESPFFLMFARDPIMPLTTLLQPTIRYLGDDQNMIDLQAFQNMQNLKIHNLRLARQKLSNLQVYPKPLQRGDLVMVRNFIRKTFDARFDGQYRIIQIKGNQVQVRPTEGGKEQWFHISDVKYILPVDNVIAKAPDIADFGRRGKYSFTPQGAVNLNWTLTTTVNTTPITTQVLLTRLTQTTCTKSSLTTVVPTTHTTTTSARYNLRKR